MLLPARVPQAARAERQRDREGLPAVDPGPDRAIAGALAWLGRAQDHSATRDGGVARHYSLLNGWSSSYPETTGYLIPTLLEHARLSGGREAETARARAVQMLDWLVSIQLPCGGFQGGMVDESPVVPVTFNTGQILLGLAAGVRAFGRAYLPALTRAADWLVETQDDDGCWRDHPSPFADPGEKSYETHVAWGLIEADRVAPCARHHDAALANVSWALSLQRPSGWFDRCGLAEHDEPLTHTIGYALRGVIEAFRTGRDPALLAASKRTADGVLSAMRPDGFLPGRLDDHWQPAADWACLTGTVQLAACWLLLFQETGDERYRDAARRANAYVRRTMRLEPDVAAGIRGGVKGAFPIDGGYGPYEYLNWGCKFLIDAHLLEATLGA